MNRREFQINLGRWSLLSFISAVGGCTRREVTTEPIIAEDDAEYIVEVILDLSGSFSNLMAEGGRGYDFALQVLDHYFRERLGSHDKVILAQISATQQALLWQGTPADLRRDFASPASFRDFLLQKSDPHWSRVHEGIAQALEYLTSEPAVANKKAKSAVFVLSDLIDNSPDGTNTSQRLVQALAAYGALGGVIGMFYVDQQLVPSWRRQLAAAGVRNFTVESVIVQHPTLPNFE